MSKPIIMTKHERNPTSETMKDKLGNFPILWCPNFTKTFELHTDWSALDMGVCLTQKDDGD